MSNLILQNIYYKQDLVVEEYMVIVFETNKGVFEAAYGRFTQIEPIAFTEFTKAERIEDLRIKYGILTIEDVRVTYDSQMYFFISNQFMITSRFGIPSDRMVSFQGLFIEEDLYGSNKEILEDFLTLDKIVIPK